MTATLDDYLRDPQEIARRSFEIVRAETDLAGLPADVGEIALRVVHACGMPEIAPDLARSEEHTSELQSLMRISYAVFCLKKKKNTQTTTNNTERKHQVWPTLTQPTHTQYI